MSRGRRRRAARDGQRSCPQDAATAGDGHAGGSRPGRSARYGSSPSTRSSSSRPAARRGGVGGNKARGSLGIHERVRLTAGVLKTVVPGRPGPRVRIRSPSARLQKVPVNRRLRRANETSPDHPLADGAALAHRPILRRAGVPDDRATIAQWSPLWLPWESLPIEDRERLAQSALTGSGVAALSPVMRRSGEYLPRQAPRSFPRLLMPSEPFPA